jgi:hypothetical protein
VGISTFLGNKIHLTGRLPRKQVTWQNKKTYINDAAQGVRAEKQQQQQPTRRLVSSQDHLHYMAFSHDFFQNDPETSY